MLNGQPCPRCYVDNGPEAIVCAACGTPLQVVALEEHRLRAVYVALGVAMGVYVVARMIGLGSPVALLLGMFYGPLASCYLARGSAVAPASLGGVLALLIVVFFTIVDEVAATERQLVALVGHPKASLSAIYVALAVVVLAAVLWPVALTGGAVGEHLAVRRRSRGG